MLILLDHSTPAPLRYALKDHMVVEAVERGWERLVNGALLEAAEAAGFEVFVTSDKNILPRVNAKIKPMKTLRPLTMEQFARAEERLLHPLPGSRIEAAGNYGIDLTLLVEQLRLTPAERAKKLELASTALERVRGVARRRS